MLFRHAGPPGPTTPGGLLVVERPAPGLARGKYAASPLFILSLGALLALGTLLYYFFRLRKHRT